MTAPAGERAHKGCFPPRNTEFQDQAVKAIIFSPPGPDRRNGLFKRAFDHIEVERAAINSAHRDILHPHEFIGVVHSALDLVRGFGDDIETHALKDWHRSRQGGWIAHFIKLGLQDGFVIIVTAISAHAHIFALDLLELFNVAQRFSSTKAVTIASGEACNITLEGP